MLTRLRYISAYWKTNSDRDITVTSPSDCLVSYPGHSLGWGLPLYSPSRLGKIKDWELFRKSRLDYTFGRKINIRVLGHNGTSRLIGSGLPNRPLDKVVCCKSLTTLSPDQWLLNYQDSFGLPRPTGGPTEGVLPLCRGEVGVFYCPCRQGGFVWGALPLCKEAVGVFYSPSRLGKMVFKAFVWLLLLDF